MWRMRTRLLTGYLVLLALGHLATEHGVVGQKYYMNFAFNNNNPDAEGGGGPVPGGGPGGQEGPPHTDGEDSGTPDGTPGENREVPADTSHGESDDSNGSDDNEDNENSGSDDGSGNSGSQNDSDDKKNDGHDDDNDDSDSKDTKDRRIKAEESEGSQEGNNRGDHSHHSSYEISIDDSFGGRYVRSIYESSESHGHSGSKAGSNQRDSGTGPQDSSAEEVPSNPRAPEDDYEEM
ncbi:accessory gland protein Acp32CD [Drosophila gunungcola]|uniref:Accessory gland protein Acp32CD n=1 Tax=Drosophila gunungcola TaxID=103775 RepID=A0A9P9YV73_9MUSC|nr:accessory gland protein Acp32CD [Drosophila gunungcola]KAI8043681.1 hypothetical protein M5D96_005014 [Drosophila gunungcola]